MSKVMVKPTQEFFLQKNPHIGKTRAERDMEISNRERACKLLNLRINGRLTKCANQKMHSAIDGFLETLQKAYGKLGMDLAEARKICETRNKSSDIPGLIDSWAEAYIDEADKSYRHVAMDYIRKTFRDGEARAAAKAYFDIRARQHATEAYERLGLPVSFRHSLQDYARIIVDRQLSEDRALENVRYSEEEPNEDDED